MNIFAKTAGKKNANRLAGRIREGYKTLISEEEVCISRVGIILLIINVQWNVANRRVTDCHSDKLSQLKIRDLIRRT
jgi:hypothetical protein